MDQHIILLGHSAAILSFIKTIRSENKDIRISLFPGDQRLPYNRSLLSDVLANEKEAGDIVWETKQWYQDHQVDLYLDETVIRINTNRQKITISSKEQLDYTHLFVADVPQVTSPQIKGHRKTGLFTLDRWASVDALIQYLSFVDTVAIQVETLSALKAAFAISQYGRDIVLIFPNTCLFDAFDTESAKMLLQMFEQRNISAVEGEIISEVLGDSDIKAIRLVGGKVIAAEMVVFEQSEPDFRVFNDCDSNVKHLSVRPDSLMTDFNHVWATDYVARSTNGSLPLDEENLEEQGRIVARRILGHDDHYEPADHKETFVSAGAFNCGWIGETHLNEGGAEFSSFDSQADVFRKIFVEHGCLKGSILMNAFEDRPKLRRLWDEGIDISGVEKYVLQSNFSVDDVVKMRASKASEGGASDNISAEEVVSDLDEESDLI